MRDSAVRGYEHERHERMLLSGSPVHDHCSWSRTKPAFLTTPEGLLKSGGQGWEWDGELSLASQERTQMDGLNIHVSMAVPLPGLTTSAVSHHFVPWKCL